MNYLSPSARLAIYAEGQLDQLAAKTAAGVIRYGGNPIAAIIDSKCAGKSIRETMGIDCPAPIVASLQASLPFKPDALLLGTAPVGGQLPATWRQDIVAALRNGLDVVNGLHDFLGEDPEIRSVADKCQRTILDVRKPPSDLSIASGKARAVKAFVVLTVGTDSSIGKMTTTLEIVKAAKTSGLRGKFVATGQTGIMIAGGEGIAIDRVIGDFMAGAAERLVLEAAQNNDFVFVEGQGSLAHPGFSGVSLSLMHGACPKAMILCHQPTRTLIGKSADFPMISLPRIIAINEAMAALMQPAKIVAIALNTSGLDTASAQVAIEKTKREVNLPCTDPVRFGGEVLLDAILTHKEHIA